MIIPKEKMKNRKLTESKKPVGKRRLTESRWLYKLGIGRALRAAIEDEDLLGIVAMLQLCYQELAEKGIIDDDDCDAYVEELDEIDLDDEDAEDEIDYQLEQFYDMCDNLRVWIPLRESISKRKNLKESVNGKFEVLFTYWDGDADYKQFATEEEATEFAKNESEDKQSGGFIEVREYDGNDTFRIIDTINTHLEDSLKESAGRNFEVLFTYTDGDADCDYLSTEEEAIDHAKDVVVDNGGFAEVREVLSSDRRRLIDYFNTHFEDWDKDESLKESMDDVWKDYESIEQFLDKNNFTNYDLVGYSEYPMSTSKISIRVDGDWKHDHLYFQDLIEEWAGKNNRDIFKIDKDVEPSDDDWYAATYHIYVTKDKDSLDKLNSMRRLFASEPLRERNLTKSERANRNANRIFKDYHDRLERMKDFLRKNTDATEEEIRVASHNTGLHSSDKDLWGLLKKYGVYDEFFAQDKKNESLKESDENFERELNGTDYAVVKGGEIWGTYSSLQDAKDELYRIYDQIEAGVTLDKKTDYCIKAYDEYSDTCYGKCVESLYKPTKINIRESLNKIDWDTDNRYDLRNMYDSAKGMTKENKVELVKMISLNESYRKMYNYLKKFI